jgi:hypothetical protein
MDGPMQTNLLSYGDNLDILRRYLPDAAIDLVYLDTGASAEGTRTFLS